LTRGHREANYLILGSHSGGCRALLAQDQPRNAAEKTASHGAAGAAARGKEVFEKKMRHCGIFDSGRKEN